MKQFTNTRFFLLLKRNGNDTPALKQEYDNFAALLLEKGNIAADKTAYRNTLVYTRLELSGLTGVAEKKCIDLC